MFEIIYNCEDWINKKKDIKRLMVDFVIEIKKSIKKPGETKKRINPISLHYIHLLTQKLNLKDVDEKKKIIMKNFKEHLETIFVKLCYDENSQI